MRNSRYPRILIRSKNELAKRLSSSKLSARQALDLINDATTKKDQYWHDTKHSKPDEGKYIRSAKGKPLGDLLHRINNRVLAPYDALLPPFIFGGISNSSHVKAATYLLGAKKKRTLLKTDVSRFFEQVSSERVYQFFSQKCACDPRAAKLLSEVCCVPEGPKGNGAQRKTIARGFSTSPRLAVWCNLDLFIKLHRLIQKRLRGMDPRLSIFVDDIGITASRVPREVMEALLEEIKALLAEDDPNQSLKLKDSKTEIVSHEQGMEILGTRLLRNRLALGSRAHKRRDRLRNQVRLAASSEEKNHLRRKLRSSNSYKRYVEGGK